MGQLAGDGELQHQRRDSVSAPWMGKSVDKHFTIADKEDALPRRADLKTLKRSMWSPQQKNVFWLRVVVQKPSKAYDLMTGFCAETRSTAKAFMLLDQHKRFSVYDVDPEMLSVPEVDLVLAVAFPVRSSKLKITGSGEVEAAPKVFTDETTTLFCKKKATVWKN